MDNIFLIVIISLVLAVLIIFLIIRNRKDERKFEDQLKNDYHKPRAHDADTGENQKIWWTGQNVSYYLLLDVEFLLKSVLYSYTIW